MTILLFLYAIHIIWQGRAARREYHFEAITEVIVEYVGEPEERFGCYRIFMTCPRVKFPSLSISFILSPLVIVSILVDLHNGAVAAVSQDVH
jgi:hypothetical protein